MMVDLAFGLNYSFSFLKSQKPKQDNKTDKNSQKKDEDMEVN